AHHLARLDFERYVFQGPESISSAWLARPAEPAKRCSEAIHKRFAKRDTGALAATDHILLRNPLDAYSGFSQLQIGSLRRARAASGDCAETLSAVIGTGKMKTKRELTATSRAT